MKFDSDVAHKLSVLTIAAHLSDRLRALGDPPARFVQGDAISNAKDLVGRWREPANAHAFYVLATASGWMTKAEIARHAKTTKGAVHRFCSRLLKFRVPVIREGGELVELAPFRDDHELFFRLTAKNDVGEVVKGGIRMKLNTEPLAFGEACDVTSTTRATKDRFVANFDGAQAMAEGASKRDRSERNKARAEFERAREARVKGPQLPLITQKTGTEGE